MSNNNNNDTTAMEYARLGKTGLRVSRICLGFMSYGDKEWNGWALNSEESLAMIKKAYDAGINFFDTADVYSNGKSEEILGKAIKQFNMPRDRIVVATKVCFPVLEGSTPVNLSPEAMSKDPQLVNRFGLSRKHIFDACDASLKRLDVDYIDLYQIHRFDQNTPIEETMEALHDLVKSGKVRYIGASSMHAWEFQKANNIAEKNGWTKFVSMQNLYNLVYREEEREVIPYSLDAGIGGIPWSPLAMGKLAGRKTKTQRSETDVFQGMNRMLDADNIIVERVGEIAEKKSVSSAQVSLAWLLSKPYVTAPIVGISKEAHLYDAIASLKVKLTEEEIKYLEEPYVPKPLIPM
ncbi:aldo keto reductase [Lichtheimia corymbifera JMRC:FSU:9682]|uniref:Aldo keto reductase n=2 Tax=Lichtheimia corymbifera JMRC:FSU:9682 TaxID=1263082 RepID=A0A068SBD5_9FUNG|nr:aldo keto reductase [Lichtheimia corymbifera JMRC:FSU:9682]CDH59599.1 aldo keto reductase [Lichtheimia corymbifera JMRC:FSU:9682]